MSNELWQPGIRSSFYSRGVTSDIVESLLQAIREERYKPGDKLPSERQLSEMFGVGRGSVREALRALQTMGMVKIVTGKGAYVLEPGTNHADYYALWNNIHPVPLEHIIEVRLSMEPIAAALAAQRSTEGELEKLAASMAALEQAKERNRLEERLQADIAFHDTVFEASGNLLLKDFNARVEPLMRESRRLCLVDPDFAVVVLRSHTGIYQAIKNRDPAGAWREMLEHVLSFEEEAGARTEIGAILRQRS